MGLIANQNHTLEDWNLQSKGIYDFVFTSKSDPRSEWVYLWCQAYIIAYEFILFQTHLLGHQDYTTVSSCQTPARPPTKSIASLLLDGFSSFSLSFL